MKVDFLNGLPVAKSANFENNVIKSLPEGVTQIYLDSCGMERCSGYGSYNFFLRVEINNNYVTLKEHTNSAPAFDHFVDLEYGSRSYQNWIKATTLMLLEQNKDLIIELIQQQDNA